MYKVYRVVAHRIGIVYEIDKPEIARIQEVSFEVSSDSGAYFRKILRQEYNFSLNGDTLQRKEMKPDLSRNTDLKMTIKPDKGNLNCLAKL